MHIRKVIPALLFGLLAAPAAAQAHISLHPNTIPAGAFATLDVRVPGEQEGAHVTKVDVLFPPGFVGVDYENVAGWSTHVIETKLATPITEDGETIDTEVSQIVWTWSGPLGKVDNGQFINLPLSLAIPDDAAGKPLEFRTVQTYSNGAGGPLDRPFADGRTPLSQDQRDGQGRRRAGSGRRRGGAASGGDELEPGDRRDHGRQLERPSGNASQALGIAALVVGILGLLSATVALLMAQKDEGRCRRRSQAAPAFRLLCQTGPR